MVMGKEKTPDEIKDMAEKQVLCSNQNKRLDIQIRKRNFTFC